MPVDTSTSTPTASSELKKDADYVFYELTRSICPECRRVIDAQILIRDNKVFMRKRCPDHGVFEARSMAMPSSTPTHRGSTSPAPYLWSSRLRSKTAVR